jgi:uncharacterized DUF497 family protein
VDFRWNAWNTEHVAAHGIGAEAAEHVVEEAKAPFPRRIGEDKLLVWGPAPAGELLQVIFVVDEDGSTYVLHARPLTEREKRRYRRQRR